MQHGRIEPPGIGDQHDASVEGADGDERLDGHERDPCPEPTAHPTCGG
jgi:hypothetical protein